VSHRTHRRKSAISTHNIEAARTKRQILDRVARPTDLPSGHPSGRAAQQDESIVAATQASGLGG